MTRPATTGIGWDMARAYQTLAHDQEHVIEVQAQKIDQLVLALAMAQGIDPAVVRLKFGIEHGSPDQERDRG